MCLLSGEYNSISAIAGQADKTLCEFPPAGTLQGWLAGSPKRFLCLHVVWDIIFMAPENAQFRLSTLFHLTTGAACVVGFLRAFGLEGVLALILLTALPLVVVAVALTYVRVMSWLFDMIVGPFFPR